MNDCIYILIAPETDLEAFRQGGSEQSVEI